jgi:hypothetical protein
MAGDHGDADTSSHDVFGRLAAQEPDFGPSLGRGIVDNLLDLLHTLKHRRIIAQWTRIKIFCLGFLADCRWRP